MGTARLPNWRRKACADFDAGQNIPLLHYSHDNRTFYARFCWVGPLTPVHGRNVIPCSLLCSQAGRPLSQPFMRRPSRMLRPRREMFAAPAASSRACTLWKTHRSRSRSGWRRPVRRRRSTRRRASCGAVRLVQLVASHPSQSPPKRTPTDHARILSVTLLTSTRLGADLHVELAARGRSPSPIGSVGVCVPGPGPFRTTR
jgi:hypothetical protein